MLQRDIIIIRSVFVRITCRTPVQDLVHSDASLWPGLRIICLVGVEPTQIGANTVYIYTDTCLARNTSHYTGRLSRILWFRYSIQCMHICLVLPRGNTHLKDRFKSACCRYVLRVSANSCIQTNGKNKKIQKMIMIMIIIVIIIMIMIKITVITIISR